MRINDTFWVSRSTRGVTNATRVIFIKLYPTKITIMRIDKCLITMDIIQRCLRHFIFIAINNEPFDGIELVLKPLKNRYECQIDKNVLIFRMVDNINKLISK